MEEKQKVNLEFRSFSGFRIPRQMAEEFYDMFPIFAYNPELLDMTKEEFETMVEAAE